VKTLQKVFGGGLLFDTLYALQLCTVAVVSCKSRYIQPFWWDGLSGSKDFYEELCAFCWYWSLRNWKTESILEC